MNKKTMEAFKGLIVIKWEKFTNPLPSNFGCGCKSFQKAKYTHPLLFVKLN
jgi:hypothetical protein